MQRGREAGREGDLCCLINNVCFIQNQLGLHTQNMFYILNSLPSLLVEQCDSQPQNTTESGLNMKSVGGRTRGAADFKKVPLPTKIDIN